MTQDQYGQGRGSGYVVRGDVVPEEENEEGHGEQSRPMTRFQKVASALRGDKATDQDETEHDQPAATRTGGPAAAGAGAAQRDYWDEPDAAAEGHDEPVAVTRPDVPGSAMGPGTGMGTADHPATEPDMFGTTGRSGDETGPMPGVSADSRDSRDQAGAATVADVPAGGTTAAGATVADTAAPGTPAADTAAPGATVADTAAGGVPAGTAADDELRPGEAAGTLGDFSDLTYGDLIPDAAVYAEQWQQIQFKFVDDPRGSVTEAADIVAQVTAKLEAAIQERQRAIEERQRAITEQQRSLRGRWGEGTNADTETLRETLRMYKTFLNQLIGPRTG